MTTDHTQSFIKEGRRTGWWLLIVAAIVLESTACLQYIYSHAGIRKEAERRAQSELKRAELEINVISARVEMVVRYMAVQAEQYLAEPDSMFAVTRTAVNNCPDLISACIAFVPNYYSKYGKWFEPCTSSDGYSRQIGGANHDYFNLEWYHNGLTIDSCWWCEPYMDKDGARSMVVSCSYPIRNKNGEVVGVALADVSLDYLQYISTYLQVYPESFYSIQSGKGIDIVAKPDTVPGRKYRIFEENIDATGWRIAIIIPDDVIYAELKHIGLIVTFLILIGLVMLVFIMVKSGKDTLALIRTTGQNERMERELTIARHIQMAMLPTSFPPYEGCQDLNMYGIVIPAKEVGGDLYDFFVKDHNLFFCIGDVSGKGVPAAFVMGVIRSLFRAIAGREIAMENVCSQMNDTFAENNEQNMFATIFFGRFDMQTGELHYCNAGHNAPLVICRQNKEIVENLPVVPNLPLGVLSGYKFEPQKTALHRGDALFLYTDGLTEAENIRQEQFGEQRMIEVLKRCILEQKEQELSMQSMVETMLNSVKDFAEEAEQSDDLTILAFKYLPFEQQPEPQPKTPVEKYSIVMRNDIQQIPTLAEWVDGLALPKALNMSINLALEEAVSNVMLYAYPDTDNGQVLIEAIKTKDEISFVISDSGVPFDPTKASEPDITLPAEDRPIGGLGIHLIRQIMDSITYARKDDRNILTLTKILQSAL